LIAAQAVAAGLAIAGYGREPAAGDWPLFLSLSVLGVVAGAFKIELCARWGRLTMAFAVTIFALLALGAGAALVVNALAAVGGLCFNQREGGRRFSLGAVPGHRLLFNVANYILCVGAAEVAFRLLGGRAAPLEIPRLALPVFGATVTYYLVNTGGVAAALGWSGGRSVFGVWRENFGWAVTGYLATACGAAGALYLYQRLAPGPAALFLLPPLFLVFQSYRVHVAKIRGEVAHVHAVNRLSQSIITSLALAIDAKDRTTHRHIHRVREYAVALAEALRVPAAELEAIKIAALLHDIGKLGIPERILCKPDKLTAEEFRVIQGHVDLGARILEPVEFPWPVIPIVLTHHERWDGLGYPRRLSGEAIPLGGRIVAVVDAFDALTSERPYRQALSRDAALELIRNEAGSQFDPQVVQTFEQVLPMVEARIRELEGLSDGRAGAGRRPPATAAAATGGSPGAAALQGSTLAGFDPALRPPPGASQEEALAWLCRTLLAALPASTVCVYLERADGELRVTHSEGLLAERWAGMRVRPGEGAAGRAALRGEIVMNAPASMDLARRQRPGENLELSSALAVPIRAVGGCRGAAVLYHTGYEIYREEHASTAARLIERTAGALGQCAEFPRAGPRLPAGAV
jgi:putative nucleotidyltransferase with HDIG domain